MPEKISVSDFPQLLLYTLACYTLLSPSPAVRSSNANIEIFSRRLGQRIPDFDNQNTRIQSRSQWPLGLRRGSAAARLLRSWVRIPPGAWMSVCCEYCVLSGRGLCDELITRPEDSYRL